MTRAYLEVIVELDYDQIGQLEMDGYKGPEIERMIEKAITLTERRQPVSDIAEVKLVKFAD